MALIVQKYGGTSVGSVERINAVAKRVHQTVREGHRVAVVVSAMGKTTDTLVSLAQEISTQPSRREMDMLLSTGEQVSIALLSMALHELGQPAISMTGAQVGIKTEAEHGRARILKIPPDRMQRHLDQGEVVVVAGFQGISNDKDLEITTLGRGGSDTSAVALAVALQAQCCEIYTDVPGILSADPRLVSEAQLMAEITCDEMLELASLGAKVLHPRAVELARNYGMPLVVRSSWSEEPGTQVLSLPPRPRSLEGLEIAKAVDAVEFDLDQARVALLRVPDRPGVAAQLFNEIAHQQIDVDLIIQSIHEGNSNDIAFTVTQAALAKAEAVTEAIAPVLRSSFTTTANESEVIVEREVAKVEIAGAGLIGRPSVAAQMFKTLSEAEVNIDMISTSEVKISCIVAREDCDRAIRALCRTFAVSSSPTRTSDVSLTQAAALVRGVAVRGVALDLHQARLALCHVPHQPGMAADIFSRLAQENICVTTIIQSQRCYIINDLPTRDIAFTVPQADADTACRVLNQLASEHGFKPAVVDAAIAKISIVGAGMVNYPGVAGRFFEALFKAEINIQMIATSEIKVSCVIAQDDGAKALQAVHQAFALAGETMVTVPA